MNVGQWLEWELAEETEVPGENPLKCHPVHQRFRMIWAAAMGAHEHWKNLKMGIILSKENSRVEEHYTVCVSTHTLPQAAMS
jgi:hypothetical protein